MLGKHGTAWEVEGLAGGSILFVFLKAFLLHDLMKALEPVGAI